MEGCMLLITVNGFSFPFFQHYKRFWGSNDFTTEYVCGPLLPFPHWWKTKWIITIRNGWKLLLSGIYLTVSITSYAIFWGTTGYMFVSLSVGTTTKCMHKICAPQSQWRWSGPGHQSAGHRQWPHSSCPSWPPHSHHCSLGYSAI